MAEDTFQKVASKFQNSPTVVVLFVASVVMLIIGINQFAEDTYSSYLGLKSLEQTFGLNVQIFAWTYWIMSITPQIASIVFFYMYLATNEAKYLVISLGFQAADIFSDTWYRSDTRMLNDPKTFLMSLALTIIFFTLGSEFFLTVSVGLILKLYAPALREWNKARGNIRAAKGGGGGGGDFKMKDKSGGGGDKGNGDLVFPVGNHMSARERAEMRGKQGGGKDIRFE